MFFYYYFDYNCIDHMLTSCLCASFFFDYMHTHGICILTVYDVCANQCISGRCLRG